MLNDSGKRMKKENGDRKEREARAVFESFFKCFKLKYKRYLNNDESSSWEETWTIHDESTVRNEVGRKLREW